MKINLNELNENGKVLYKELYRKPMILNPKRLVSSIISICCLMTLMYLFYSNLELHNFTKALVYIYTICHFGLTTLFAFSVILFVLIVTNLEKEKELSTKIKMLKSLNLGSVGFFTKFISYWLKTCIFVYIVWLAFTPYTFNCIIMFLLQTTILILDVFGYKYIVSLINSVTNEELEYYLSNKNEFN